MLRGIGGKVNHGTIEIGLRLGIRACLMLSFLLPHFFLGNCIARGGEYSPDRTEKSEPIRGSHPLRKAQARPQAVRLAAEEVPTLPPLPGEARFADRVVQARERSDNPEFDYPLPPPSGNAPPANGSPGSEPNVVEPLFDSLVPGEGQSGVVLPDNVYPDQWVFSPEECEECDDDSCCGRCSPWYRLFHLGIHEPTCDMGIGQERVMFAPYSVDFSQPTKYYRLRADMAYGNRFPDRAEYFWAKPSKGPKFIERSVDYQDIRFQFESGGPLFSIFSDYPVRILDPEINDNTAGFGDMIVGNKAVLINGQYWQLTQVLRTYINTGDPRRGLSTAHTSMEPGLILRYKWTPKTYIHGELKYFTPVGADPMFSGAILNYGFSLATVLYETDTFAVLPTLEATGHSVLDGQQTVPLTVALDGSVPNLDPTRPVFGQFPYIGQPVDVNGATFGTIQSGVRFVLGPKGDLGLFEMGVNGAVSTANNAFFDHRVQVEFRWSY